MKWFLIIGAAGLGLAACASPPAGPAAAPSPSMPGMPAMSVPASAAPTAAVNEVSIKDFAFSPADTTVRTGTTVTWKNADQDPHTVTSAGNAGPLRSPTLNQGDTYRYTFTKAGRYEYLCTIHPFMTATVTVTP